MNTLQRAAAVLRDPPAAWKRIAEGPADPLASLVGCVALLALVPAICGFVGACMVGAIVHGAGVVRAPLLRGAFGALFGYLEAFVLVLLLGGFIDLGLPLFGGRRDFARALRLAVCSYTPVWLAGVFLLLPGLRFLMLGGFYGTYVLYAGLPYLIKSPPPRARGFAAAIVAFACVLTAIAAVAQRTLFAGSGGL